MTTTATATHPSPSEHLHEEHHDHPTDRTYWVVGAILGVLTALEVSTYFITDDPYEMPWMIPALLVMMVAKFFTIGAYFMHLKFDSSVFRYVFIAGLVLAVGVYMVVLFSFAYFDDSWANAG